MVDGARAAALAMGLPGVSRVAHFDRIAFRTVRKMFATLGATGEDLNLMFNPDLRDLFCDLAPQAFTPVSGGWGVKGATRCDLFHVDEDTLMSALLAAHKLAEPKR